MSGGITYRGENATRDKMVNLECRAVEWGIWNVRAGDLFVFCLANSLAVSFGLATTFVSWLRNPRIRILAFGILHSLQ
jgi:hypothetical protein